jgi:membrane fusion protein (multidrug efflux system)
VALSWGRFRAVFRYDLVWRTLIFVAAVAVLLIIVTRWNQWESDSEWQSTDDAFLQADLTPIASKVSGYIKAIPVQDFDRVHAGDVLAEIVDDDYQAAVAQINAGIAAAGAQVEALQAQRPLQEANVRAAKATAEVTAANIEQNARDLTRQERLLKTGSSSTEASEKLQTTRAQLTAQLEQSRAQRAKGRLAGGPIESHLHPHPGAPGRRHRPAANQARPIRGRGNPNYDADAASPRLGDRQL